MTVHNPAHERPPSQGSQGDLTCQWCSVRLPAGETRCPTCGSPGIPDPSLPAPGIELLETPERVEPLQPPEGPHEWWLDDDEVEHQQRRAAMSPNAVEDRLLKTVAILAGVGAAFTLLGWLIGPLFLSPLMESITDTPVETASDLRPMGSVLGLLIGLFFGASYGWIAQAER